MAKKRRRAKAKKRTSKRKGPRKMTALQRKYFGKGRKKRSSAKRSTAKRSTAKRTRRKASVRRTVRREEKGLRSRVKRLEEHASAQKSLNHKQHTWNKVVLHGMGKLFSHTGLSKPRGMHAPSLTKQLGG